MPLPLFLAGAALKLSPVTKFLKAVPWQVWAVAALILVAGVGKCVHSGKVSEFGDKRYAEGRASRDAEIRALQDQKAAADRKLAAELRSKADEANRRIDASAGRLRVSGPGKAACTHPASAGTSAGGHQPAAAEANAAGPGVPAADWAAVPWGWLVTRAQEHDKCLVEAGSWRAQKDAEIKAAARPDK